MVCLEKVMWVEVSQLLLELSVERVYHLNFLDIWLH